MRARARENKQTPRRPPRARATHTLRRARAHHSVIEGQAWWEYLAMAGAGGPGAAELARRMAADAACTAAGGPAPHRGRWGGLEVLDLRYGAG